MERNGVPVPAMLFPIHQQSGEVSLTKAALRYSVSAGSPADIPEDKMIMNKLTLITAAMLTILPAAGLAGEPDDLLKGIWIDTVSYKDMPRTELHFGDNSTIKIVNLEKDPVTVTYTVDDLIDNQYRVKFQYSHQVVKPNGREVTFTEYFELLYHEDDGFPVLSQEIMEFDGRGIIIMTEYMKKDALIDNFSSALKKRLNGRKPVSSYREMPPDAE